jgi:hypothetical protein
MTDMTALRVYIGANTFPDYYWNIGNDTVVPGVEKVIIVIIIDSHKLKKNFFKKFPFY